MEFELKNESESENAFYKYYSTREWSPGRVVPWVKELLGGGGRSAEVHVSCCLV